MSTRSAAKRELERTRLSIPSTGPFTSIDNKPAEPNASRAKKQASTKTKKIFEPIKGDWDVLPHGLGGAMNLEDDGFEDVKSAKKNLAMRNKKVVDTSQMVKHDESEDVEPARKKRVVSKTKAVDTSKQVVDKANELATITAKAVKERKPKAHKYGLTPGKSPFPDHVMPTPDACEEVNQILSDLHGEVRQPAVIPPPSLAVAGCGEVPDALDAIVRTYLSSNTSANNSNLALQGLIKAFGLRTSGRGEGSINWEAVLAADVKDVETAIRSGGMAPKKSKSIKKLLELVQEDNRVRRDALVKERETGKEADITGAKHETKEAKDREIMKTNENMLSMDHIFEMTTDDAMEELIKLPGIAVKTASCVILFCMKRPSFAVDTHVLRHCKMLGWVPASATANKTFSHCEVRVPDHLKYSLHQLFLKHGRTCGRCTMTGSWEEYNNTICPIEHLVDRSIVVPKKRKQSTVKTSDSESEE
ncbi:DNA glycosylase [Hyphodiscus hymeniophilus]|uniref:DNA glycosylase n=1 Tax=Hyphodiscus hymeniophilus TaxID=353542 RepID=A0A9P6VNT8_9HELO|nr:DNA glycosylase [Hyphodiscus hymeniophilus]